MTDPTNSEALTRRPCKGAHTYFFSKKHSAFTLHHNESWCTTLQLSSSLLYYYISCSIFYRRMLKLTFVAARLSASPQ